MSVMSVVWMIVVGFVVGALARFLYPGTIPMGFWVTALLGVGGSMVGGLISMVFFRSSDGRFHPAGWILSILGALILLYAYLNFAR